MTVFVLGAGPSGLALIDGLVDGGTDRFVALELNATAGGLAQTTSWKTYGSHDLGPHKIFTKDKALLDRVKNLLPREQWLVRPKSSRVFMKGHFLPYPPSPFSMLKVYGPLKFAGMVFDYGLGRHFSSKHEARTFEEDLRSRLGESLYSALFRPIALKLWGDPKNLDVKLSKGRVQTPSVFEILRGMLGRKKQSEFEALEFVYPRGGLQGLWKSIERKAAGRGQILTQTEVTSIEVHDQTVREIKARDRVTGQTRVFEVQPDDMVFSTLPLELLAGLLGSFLSPVDRGRIREVVCLNDLLLVFLKVEEPQLFEDSWIFVPDPEIVFHRVSEQKSFDPGMTPKGSIVCCEIMSNDSRPMSAKTDLELVALAREGLAKMGLGSIRVQDQKVIRLPRSYPVFRPRFEEGLREILRAIDRLENLKTIGRQGAFNYIGTLDAMDIGYGASRWFLGQVRGKKIHGWEEERTRTGFYPVLD